MLESRAAPRMEGLEPPEVVAILAREWAVRRLWSRRYSEAIIPHSLIPSAERQLCVRV